MDYSTSSPMLALLPGCWPCSIGSKCDGPRDTPSYLRPSKLWGWSGARNEPRTHSLCPQHPCLRWKRYSLVSLSLSLSLPSLSLPSLSLPSSLSLLFFLFFLFFLSLSLLLFSLFLLLSFFSVPFPHCFLRVSS